MTDIEDIEGIGPAYATRLKAIGVTTVERLLEEGATRAGRQKLAEVAGVRDDQVLRWVNHADLYRVLGIEGVHAELLEACGVDSVPELAQRSPANLQKRMEEVNERKKIARRIPSESQVTAWVAEAKTLPRVVTH